jgi:hypothetical protein
VIDSEARLAAVLARVAQVGRQDGWEDNRARFRAAIEEAKVDFSREVLVLVRQTELSFATRVWFRLADGPDGALRVLIFRDDPPERLPLYREYCFAAVVRRDRARRIEVWRQDEVLGARLR